MAEPFKKILCISSETSRLSREEFLLERYSWQDISKIRNLSDYDHIHLNLTALADVEKIKPLNDDGRKTIFNAKSWADIIMAEGSIFLVGDFHYRLADCVRGDE